MLNTTFSPVVSTTLKNYSPTLIDNLTNNNVLLWTLKQFGGIDYEEGGTSIVQPLNARKNTTVKSFAGYDIFDTTPQNDITAAEFPWKQVGGSFSISGIEDFMNSGRQQVINLWDGKMENLEVSSQLEINRQLYGDGTGNNQKDIDGLGIAVEDGAAWSNYGQIDSQVETWWRNVFFGQQDAAGEFAGNYTTAGALQGIMRRVFNSASRGAEKPNLILGAQVLYETFESQLTVNERFIKDGSFGADLANAGFRNLEFKGAWFVFDYDITPNVATAAADEARGLLMLNTKYIRFVGGLDRMFAVTDFQRPDNQDAWVALVISYCNLVTKNRARQARAEFGNP